MMSALLPLLLPTFATSQSGPSLTTVLNFNYNWRFNAPTDEASNDRLKTWCDFTPIAHPSDCSNLERDPNRFSADDCRSACCYRTDCSHWVYNTTIIPHCYHGSASAGSHCPLTNEVAQLRGGGPNVLPFESVGGVRLPSKPHPIPTDYEEAAASYPPDQGWPLVTTPHDSVIATAAASVKATGSAYTESVADTEHGYMNRTTAGQNPLP